MPALQGPASPQEAWVGGSQKTCRIVRSDSRAAVRRAARGARVPAAWARSRVRRPSSRAPCHPRTCLRPPRPGHHPARSSRPRPRRGVGPAHAMGLGRDGSEGRQGRQNRPIWPSQNRPDHLIPARPRRRTAVADRTASESTRCPPCSKRLPARARTARGRLGRARAAGAWGQAFERVLVHSRCAVSGTAGPRPAGL
jgi:hypothetical protein